MLDKALKTNFSYLLLLQTANYLTPLILLPFLTHILGAEKFGKIVFAQAIVGYFVMLTDYGFNTSSAQLIVMAKDDKFELSRIFWSTTTVKLLFATACFGLLAFITFTIPRLNEIATLILIASTAIITTLLFPVWLFQGLEQMKIISLLNIIPRILVVFLSLITVKTQDDYTKALIIQSSGPFLGASLASLLVWKRSLVNFYIPSIADLSRTIRNGWFIFFSGLATSLYTSTNLIILGFMSTDTVVGIFSAAEKLTRAIIALFSSATQVTFPRINSLYLESKSKAFQFARWLILRFGIMLLLVAIFLLIAAPLLVDLLFGLPQFQQAITLLRISAFLPLLAVINGILAINILITFGLSKQLAQIVATGGIFSLITIFPAIYFFNMYGVAACALLTELIIMILLYRQINRSALFAAAKKDYQ